MLLDSFAYFVTLFIFLHEAEYHAFRERHSLQPVRKNSGERHALLFVLSVFREVAEVAVFQRFKHIGPNQHGFLLAGEQVAKRVSQLGMSFNLSFKRL